MIPQALKSGQPEPGFYRMRLVKGGPWVPVRIWLEDGERERCEVCGGAGAVPEQSAEGYTGRERVCSQCGGDGTLLVSDQVLRAKVGDQERDPLKIWTFLWDITEEEYNFLLSRARWATAHNPTAPEANPKRPIRQTDVALDMPAVTIYRGTRSPADPELPGRFGALAVIVYKPGLDAYQLPVCLGLRAHSPDGFECGYQGSGPMQLALALLADHLGDHGAAMAHYGRLAARIVARLPRKCGWKLSSDEIDRALEEKT